MIKKLSLNSLFIFLIILISTLVLSSLTYAAVSTTNLVDYVSYDIYDGATSSDACLTNYDPVCADGVEYANSCIAQKVGVMNMTMGVCS